MKVMYITSARWEALKENMYPNVTYVSDECNSCVAHMSLGLGREKRTKRVSVTECWHPRKLISDTVISKLFCALNVFIYTVTSCLCDKEKYALLGPIETRYLKAGSFIGGIRT